MGASTGQPRHPPQAGRPEHPRAEPAARPAEPPSAPEASARPGRPLLRVVSGPRSAPDEAAARQDGIARRTQKLVAREIRRRRAESAAATSGLQVPQVMVTPALVRCIIEEIRAATTVIGGWVELVERGMLNEDEMEAACRRIQTARARVDAAGEQLELAVGIDRERLH